MATIAADPQETVLETPALEVLLELLLHIPRQGRALCGQMCLERGIVFLNKLIKEGALRAVAHIRRRTCARPGFPASRRRQHDRILAKLCWARSLRGRKYPYCKSATVVHFSILSRCVVPTMRLKRTENCPRRATFSLRVFLPRRLLGYQSHRLRLMRISRAAADKLRSDIADRACAHPPRRGCRP